MSADENYYLKMFEAFRRSARYNEVFDITMSKICKDVKLGCSIASCLAMGPNKGQCEISFLNHCEVNIRTFVAIERDHASAEYLRESLQSSLPGVESRVIETDLKNWQGPGKQIDLILMFHILYFIRRTERQEFMKKVHDHWLAPGGYLAIVSACRTKSPGNGYMIFERLGSPALMWEDIEIYLQEAGFTKHYAYEMRVKKSFENPDESLLRYYQSHVKAPVTFDDVRDAMKQLYPEGKADEFNMIAIFRKNKQDSRTK